MCDATPSFARSGTVTFGRVRCSTTIGRSLASAAASIGATSLCSHGCRLITCLAGKSCVTPGAIAYSVEDLCPDCTPAMSPVAGLRVVRRGPSAELTWTPDPVAPGGYNLWRSYYGTTGPGSGSGLVGGGSVPEPGTITLVVVAIGSVVATSRRRR